MSVFVDTSAFLALLDRDDEHHEAAQDTLEELASRDENLVTNNYVLLETFALTQHRLGLKAARTFQENFFPLLDIEWVDEQSHMTGVTGVLTAARRKLSLVDCVSFDIMRRLGIREAFTFDKHFKEQGFQCLPRL